MRGSERGLDQDWKHTGGTRFEPRGAGKGSPRAGASHFPSRGDAPQLHQAAWRQHVHRKCPGARCSWGASPRSGKPETPARGAVSPRERGQRKRRSHPPPPGRRAPATTNLPPSVLRAPLSHHFPAGVARKVLSRMRQNVPARNGFISTAARAQDALTLPNSAQPICPSTNWNTSGSTATPRWPTSAARPRSRNSRASRSWPNFPTGASTAARPAKPRARAPISC